MSTHDDDEDFGALLAASERAERTTRKVRVGDQVRGQVIALSADRAFVDVGAKAEAVLELGGLRDPETGEPTVAVGDPVDATVVDDGSQSGSIVLRARAGGSARGRDELEQAFQHGLPVEGVVTAQNKGGYEVQVGGVRAFCPGSQIDARRGDPAQYVGQRLRFRVTKFEAGGRNVVVARRPLLEEENAVRAATAWETLRVGATVRGTVTAVREFGAFVDVGGVEGLVHVSELSHERDVAAADVLAVGQEVEVQVMRLEPEAGGRGRISLSLRALAPDPWSDVPARFPIGSVVRGRVRRMEPFGAFIELAPGIDGLVHVSKITRDRRIAHPRQVLNVDDEVDATVVALDVEKRRLGLSLVEQARRAEEAAEAEDRRETDAVISASATAANLGTLGDLLAASRKPRR